MYMHYRRSYNMESESELTLGRSHEKPVQFQKFRLFVLYFLELGDYI